MKLAMIQMLVEPGAVKKNLDHAGDLIKQAAAQGADCALLPEMLDTGWCHGSCHKHAGPIPGGDSCAALSEAAREHGILVCAGISERDGQNIYNSAVLIGRAGRLLVHHRKLNELDIGHHLYAQGDRLGVTRIPEGNIGVMICADATAREGVLAKSLGYMGADIILSPSAWAVRPDHDNIREPYGRTWTEAYGQVCRDFRLWIAGVSNVGPVTEGAWAGWNCIGSSIAVGPDGEQVVQSPYGADAEAVLYVQIQPEPRPARGNAWHGFWQGKT